MKMKVWVGGNLPESALPELVETLRDDGVKLVDGWDSEQDPIEQLLRDFKEPNSIEFEFDIDIDRSTGNPVDTLDLDDYCQKHQLSYKKLIPPSTTSEGEHLNECIQYWQPGMDDRVYISTDGESEVTVRQADVLELIDLCWALSQRPLSDMPLLIHDPVPTNRLYAKACMAGKPFNEILKELLISLVGHEEVGCPPFKIIIGR